MFLQFDSLFEKRAVEGEGLKLSSFAAYVDAVLLILKDDNEINDSRTSGQMYITHYHALQMPLHLCERLSQVLGTEPERGHLDEDGFYAVRDQFGQKLGLITTPEVRQANQVQPATPENLIA